MLLAADGLPSKYIAQRLGTSQDTVRVWRRRFAAGGPDVLTHDAPGRGRKRQSTAAREQQVEGARRATGAAAELLGPKAAGWFSSFFENPFVSLVNRRMCIRIERLMT